MYNGEGEGERIKGGYVCKAWPPETYRRGGGGADILRPSFKSKVV